MLPETQALGEVVYDDPARPWRGHYRQDESGRGRGDDDAPARRDSAGGRAGGTAPTPYSCLGDTSGSEQFRGTKHTNMGRLEKAGGRLVVSVRHFPDGSMRGSISSRGNGGSSSGATRAPESRSPEQEAANRRRSARRARNKLVDMARAIDATRMLTFTIGGDRLPSPVLFKSMVTEWWRDYGVALGLPAAQVNSAELGKRTKRIHVHAGCPDFGWVDYRRIYGSWSRYCEARGYHHPLGHRVHVGEIDGSHQRFSDAANCARYLAKYIGKDFDGGTGEHAYSASDAAVLGDPTVYYRVGSYADALRSLGVTDLFQCQDLYLVEDTWAAVAGRVACLLFDVRPPGQSVLQASGVV